MHQEKFEMTKPTLNLNLTSRVHVPNSSYASNDEIKWNPRSISVEQARIGKKIDEYLW